MKKYNEALGVWTIDLKDKDFYSQGFKRKNTIHDVKKRIEILIEVLKILKECELFFLNKVHASFHPAPRQEIFISEDNFIKSLMDESICNENLKYLLLFGDTNTKLSEKLEEKLIILHLDLTIYEISIGVHSDFVLPVKDDKEYQIDLAIINSNRVENCLRRIKAEKIGNYIFPDEGMLWGESHTTIGFRVYLSNPVYDEEDFPPERKSDVEIFEFTEEQWFLGRKKTNDFFEKRRKFMRDVQKAK